MIKHSYEYKDPSPSSVPGEFKEDTKLKISVRGDRDTVRKLRDAWWKALASIGE